MLWLLLLWLAVAPVVLYCLWRWGTNSGRIHGGLAGFPGPKGGLLGNASHLQSSGTDMALLNHNLHHYYLFPHPSPCRIWFMGWSIVMLYKPEHVEALLRSTVNITKSDDYNLVRPWLGEGLLLATGDKWARRRRQLTPAFHFAILKGFLETMNEEATILCQILRERLSSEPELDIAPALSHATLDIICLTAMGYRLGAQRSGENSAYVRAIAEYGDAACWRSVRQWLLNDFVFFYLSARGREQRRNLNTLHDFTHRVILERAAERSAGRTTDANAKRRPFLDLLLDLAAQGELSMDNIREEVDTFMFEGHDTTATGLQWLVYLLGRHSEAQERCRDEVSAVWDEEEGGLRQEDLAKLPFLDACIKEAMRLYPPVPIVMRKLEAPLQLDNGWTIPAGTSAAVSLTRLHRDPEIYPHPDEFRPERFEGAEAAQRHPFAFAPFSAGPRNCIGQRFAQMEEKIVATHLLRNFRWSSPDAPEEMRPASVMVLKPTRGIRVRLQEA